MTLDVFLDASAISSTPLLMALQVRLPQSNPGCAIWRALVRP